MASKGDPRNADERRIACLFDFENIALGLNKGSKKLEIQPILDRILEKGRIVVKRAYADWTRYSSDKQELHESGFELIEVPKRRLSGKNSADIRMVVDAMDVVINREHVDTYALISGDSDFSPLVTKLREHDKYVIGIGLRDSSSTLLADNCDEFIFYEDLIVQPAPKRRKGATIEDTDNEKTTGPARKAEAFYLLVDAVKAFKREGYDSIWASMVKQTIKRKHPSFNEQRHGYDTFSDLIEDAAKHGILEVKRDEKSGNYSILGLGRRVPSGA
ncbi:MAG: NYN domain-containing protein [Planctomycetota bacterium]